MLEITDRHTRRRRHGTPCGGCAAAEIKRQPVDHRQDQLLLIQWLMTSACRVMSTRLQGAGSFSCSENPFIFQTDLFIGLSAGPKTMGSSTGTTPQQQF